MNIGENVLVTCDNWFFAPDGQQYRAVWGKVYGVRQDNEVLGIKTNRGSTNWYLEIGSMILAGCQIHYAVHCPERPSMEGWKDDEGKVLACRIWDANQ